jgi:hypothetical protein
MPCNFLVYSELFDLELLGSRRGIEYLTIRKRKSLVSY